MQKVIENQYLDLPVRPWTSVIYVSYNMQVFYTFKNQLSCIRWFLNQYRLLCQYLNRRQRLTRGPGRKSGNLKILWNVRRYFQIPISMRGLQARGRLTTTLAAGFRCTWLFCKDSKNNSKRRMIMKEQHFNRASPEQFIRPREFGV